MACYQLTKQILVMPTHQIEKQCHFFLFNLHVDTDNAFDKNIEIEFFFSNRLTIFRVWTQNFFSVFVRDNHSGDNRKKKIECVGLVPDKILYSCMKAKEEKKLEKTHH